MPRPKNPSTITQECINYCDEILSRLEELTPSGNDIIKEEITQVETYINIVKQKLPKLRRLVDFKAYSFAIIDQEGKVRVATMDEARRAIMQYPQRGGNIVEIIRKVNSTIYNETSDRVQQLFRELTMSVNTDGNQ